MTFGIDLAAHGGTRTAPVFTDTPEQGFLSGEFDPVFVGHRSDQPRALQAANAELHWSSQRHARRERWLGALST